MTDTHRHERRFSGEGDRLRRPERIVLLEIERVVSLSIEGADIHSMIDIGAGTGIFAEAFSKRHINVSGIDPNARLLDLAIMTAPDARFVQGIAEGIPFSDRSFDLAFLGHVLHETDDALKALTEAKRVARTRVVVLEWPYIEEEQGPPIDHRLKTETIEALAGEAGFRTERIRLNHMDLYRLTPLPPSPRGGRGQT